MGCHLTDLVDTPMRLSPVRHRYWSLQLQLYLISLCPLCRYLSVLLVACAVSGAYAGRGAQMRSLQAKSEKVLTVEQAYNDQVPFCFLTANNLIGLLSQSSFGSKVERLLTQTPSPTCNLSSLSLQALKVFHPYS